MSLGEPHVKQALDWILEHLAADPHAQRGMLIDEAAREFDLSPLEADFLHRHLSETLKDKPASSSRS
jgi:hypothetical protein